jgi:hypothetical protein
MKTRIAMQFLAFIAGIVFLSDCKKEPDPVVKPFQTVFENLPLCELCTNDPMCYSRKVEYELKNVEGQLYNIFTPVLYYSIKSEALKNLAIPDTLLPIWKYNFGILNPCNMPKGIINAKVAYKVRFSCKLLYIGLPAPGVSLPSLSGYNGVELTKIEILNPTAGQ